MLYCLMFDLKLHSSTQETRNAFRNTKNLWTHPEYEKHKSCLLVVHLSNQRLAVLILGSPQRPITDIYAVECFAHPMSFSSVKYAIVIATYLSYTHSNNNKKWFDWLENSKRSDDKFILNDTAKKSANKNKYFYGR